MNNKTIFIGGIGALVVIFGGMAIWNNTQPGQYDTFAQCLEERGATFFGAFWCPHCQDQKALFGRSEKHLPYVECSLPNGQGQTVECTNAGISGYPTWEFGDGSREGGLQTLEQLSAKTGCELPIS